jgi:FkbM family methyltransferase
MINLFSIIQKRTMPNKAIITHADIKRCVKIENPVVIEAGACDGRDTVRFAKKFPSGSIFAFEPLSANFEIAKARVAKYKNVCLYKMALSDKNGECELNITKDLNNPKGIIAASSLLSPNEGSLA